MDEILSVSLAKTTRIEKIRLPSMRIIPNAYLNSQNLSADLSEICNERKNASLIMENLDLAFAKIGSKKFIGPKKLLIETEETPPNDFQSNELGIKGIVTPTHARILKPIIKKPSVHIEAAKKRKPLKLLGKIVAQVNIKLESFVYWGEVIRKSNGVDAVPIGSGNYKYYIGKGNNGSLVNHIIKSRFWWTRVDNPDLANLVWTQLKHKPTLEKISSTPSRETPVEKPWKKLPQSVAEYVKATGLSLIKDSSCYSEFDILNSISSENLVVHNRLPNNSLICNKKSLFKNMKEYCKSISQDVFCKVPLTFHIEQGINDASMVSFMEQCIDGSIWIIKPGECTNRGNGIRVCNTLQEIKEIVSSTSTSRSYIIQKYIENPLLINKRKFDIRCYALVTCFNGTLQAYFYRDGYLRTTTKEFSLKNVHDKFIHLTNDAIQKNSEEYGKFESGNKLSYNDFQKFLSLNHSHINFYTDILTQIENSVLETIVCVQDSLINHKFHTFEVFGYDFMIDENFKVWLIEVNTNPCLELSCSYLAKLIPEMLENAFKIALDPMFPPNPLHKKMKNWAEDVSLNNKFSLIFSTKG